MPPLPPRPAQPASALAGAIAFESLAEIATGATARVDLCRVLASHRRAGALLAVKRLHPHVAEDPTFAKEFLDEVWMTASLRHANVVEVVGWGSDPQGQYLAFELVQGVSLLRLMKTIFETGEAFTERMVVYIASRVCLGLAAAHGLRAPNGEILNLVHRDLTPGNVLVGFNGDLKIADFGMAKAKQRLTKTLTGMRKGEPTYMAPEQASSDVIDGRADIFSLGVLLFELFAGRRPWIAKSDFEMVQITARDPPADLRELRPKIDKELVAVVNRCLEKAPEARWQSAHEIAGRLDEWLTVHGYQEDNEEALGRFVRRNAMRQMRWFERAIAGELSAEKVGRELPPRVPTYTEHTKPPVRPVLDSVPTTAAAPNAGRAASPPRPEIPKPGTRPATMGETPKPARPVDPRSIRAANAVQQLKKLAPAIEPPRARLRRPPTLNDDDGDGDGDPTDVQLRLGGSLLGATNKALADDDDDDDDAGEEVVTLVQKDDARLRAIRAEAAQMRAAAEARAKLPGAIVDEESDQRVTGVSREEMLRAAPQRVPGKRPGFPIADPESDGPTAPLPLSGKVPGGQVDPSDAPTPIKGQKAKSTPLRAVIPPPPDIPQRPFQGSPVSTLPPTPPRGRPMPQPTPAADPAAEKPGRATARPPAFDGGATRSETAAPEPAPVVPRAPDPARVTYDDVQVIDRNALQHSLTSEESVVAEADRLSIEAVRRSEEARAAQIRAERKAAAAKIASDAAALAADALRLLRASGLAAAIQRIEEARALDADLQAGKLPSGDSGLSMRPSGPVSAYPEATTTQPSAVFTPARDAAVAKHHAAPAESAGPPSFLKQIPPIGAPPPNLHMHLPAIGAPPPHLPPPSPHPKSLPAPPPSPHPQVPVMAAAPVTPQAFPASAKAGDSDALPPNLHPTILGLPSTVVISLTAIALVVGVVLILLLSK